MTSYKLLFEQNRISKLPLHKSIKQNFHSGMDQMLVVGDMCYSNYLISIPILPTKILVTWQTNNAK